MSTVTRPTLIAAFFKSLLLEKSEPLILPIIALYPLFNKSIVTLRTGGAWLIAPFLISQIVECFQSIPMNVEIRD